MPCARCCPHRPVRCSAAARSAVCGGKTARRLWDPHLRLDYAFMPARHAARLRSCRVLQPEHAGKASDHLPLEMSIEMGELAPEMGELAPPLH